MSSRSAMCSGWEGPTRPIDLNIRIIAAIRDLKQLICQGRFREDLYCRFNVVTIRLPRLSERREDIPLLIHPFIAKANKAFLKDIRGISHQALELLMHYSFPGNVRELENIIQHAAALTEGKKLIPEELPSRLRKLNLQRFLIVLSSLSDSGGVCPNTIRNHRQLGYNRRRAPMFMLHRRAVVTRAKMYTVHGGCLSKADTQSVTIKGISVM